MRKSQPQAPDTAYDTLRRASLTISHIEGASLADKMKAVQAIKEATKGYAEQRYTIAEMRHELAKATLETRRQARLNRQIVKDKAKAERAGRINAERLTRERKERGYGGLTTAGVIAGGSLIGSMGVARVGQTLQGSLERSRDVKKAATVWNLTIGVYRTSGSGYEPCPVTH